MAVGFELDDWGAFSRSVRENFRHVICPLTSSGMEMPERFLMAVQESCPHRTRTLEKGTKLWRAQLDGTRKRVRVEVATGGRHESRLALLPHGRERMVPLPDRAAEGRVNPKGIPCLYVATHPSTAMSEVRPWVHSRISLAEFRGSRKLTLVDCTGPEVEWVEVADYAVACESIAWADMNDAFSRPVTPSDVVADYAPTQIVAEVFRRAGYHGVMYKSGVDNHGSNVALFDVRYAAFKHSSLHKVASLKYKFKSEDTLVLQPEYP